MLRKGLNLPGFTWEIFDSKDLEVWKVLVYKEISLRTQKTGNIKDILQILYKYKSNRKKTCRFFWCWGSVYGFDNIQLHLFQSIKFSRAIMYLKKEYCIPVFSLGLGTYTHNGHPH